MIYLDSRLDSLPKSYISIIQLEHMFVKLFYAFPSLPDLQDLLADS